MIRIDDLVRQRLSGVEEPERPGAWGSMRELLDKEMPLAASPNRRRTIWYLSLLLLFLGSATVGGYQWYRSSIGTAGGGNLAVNEPSAALPSAAVISNSPAVTNKNISQAHGTLTENPTSTNTTPSSESSSNKPSNPSNQNAIALTATQQNTSSRKEEEVNHIPANHEASSTSHLRKHSYAAGVKATNATANRAAHQASETTTVGDVAAVTHSSTSSVEKTETNNATSLHPLHPLPATGMNTAAIRQPRLAKIKHDSVMRLELVTRRVYDAERDKYVYQIDTFPIGKFARTIMIPLPEEQEPASVATNDAGTKSQPRVSARTTAAGTAQETINSNLARPMKASAIATSNTVSSVDATANAISPAATSSNNALQSSKHGRGFRLFDFEKLSAAIENAKQQLARIEMYPGLSAGINASMFTPNALGGLQAGISSLFILNDWWSLMTELKYFQRYNTGSSVRDDYKQVSDASIEFTQQNGQDYKLYKWTDRTIRHSFNYDVVRTIELPVMLRRNWGQAYAQGGVNFMFSSAIANTETSDSLSDYGYHSELRPATHDNTAFIENDHPLVLSSDFGPRIGIGYVLSGGYMFTPNIYVDGRITQSFWDNSKTEGSKRVARDLLRTPSIQISVGYRFGPK